MNSFIDHGKFSYFLHNKICIGIPIKDLRCAAIAIITFPTSNNQIPKKVDFKNVLKNQDTKIFNTWTTCTLYKQHGDRKCTFVA